MESAVGVELVVAYLDVIKAVMTMDEFAGEREKASMKRKRIARANLWFPPPVKK